MSAALAIMLAIAAFASAPVLGSIVFWTSLIGAAWAIYTFRANTRAKHAELLLKLEENYRSNLLVMLKIEYLKDYERDFVPALKKANSWHRNPDHGSRGYSATESQAIDQLDVVIRHFLMASHLRSLGVARRSIDCSHAYYLRLFVNEEHPDLKEYLRRFWATVYFWAPLAGQPWPERAARYASQIPERFICWAKSKAHEPDRARSRGRPAQLPPTNLRERLLNVSANTYAQNYPSVAPGALDGVPKNHSRLPKSEIERHSANPPRCDCRPSRTSRQPVRSPWVSRVTPRQLRRVRQQRRRRVREDRAQRCERNPDGSPRCLSQPVGNRERRSRGHPRRTLAFSPNFANQPRLYREPHRQRKRPPRTRGGLWNSRSVTGSKGGFQFRGGLGVTGTG